MLVLALQSLKVGGHFRVLRGRRNALEACQYQRVVFAWQAQHFLLIHFAFAWQAQRFRGEGRVKNRGRDSIL